MASLLSVENLQVQFQTKKGINTAVDGVSFSVEKGRILGIVGESGCGKSVTSMSILQLLGSNARISGGSIKLDGKELIGLPEKEMCRIRGNDIAMIFQDPMTALNPTLTIGTQLMEPIMLHQNCGKKEAWTRAVDVLKRVGIAAPEAEAEALRMLELVRIPEAKQILKRYPHQLSGGMRQRVMIAMALSCKPSLLIADEPTTALDVTIQAQILQLIRQLQEEMGMAVIFITHDMGVVAEVADRVLVMYHGEAVEEGTCEQIFHNPRHPYTQSLLAAVPRLGSMRGTDEPAPFPLLRITDPEAEQLGTADMDETPVDMPEPAASAPSVSDGPVLSVDNLITRFDVETGFWGKVKRRVHAVEQVRFNLYPGETLGLVGESGCGKSTIGRSLIGLETPRSGSIVFNGQELTQVSGSQLQKLRRNIQYVFQDPYAALDPRLTVGFSIMEPLLIHKVCSRQEAERRVGELLERVDLDPAMAVRYPHEFSGGQRQRVCIARALAMNPEIIIADESVSALDVSVRAQIINLLLALQKEFRIAFLFISHDMAVIERVCHRVAVMYLGQIVELGSRRDVFENPLHPYTKRLMSAVPIPDPSRRTMSHTLLTGEIPSPVRSADYEPVVAPLKEVSPGHFVSEEQVANWF